MASSLGLINQSAELKPNLTFAVCHELPEPELAAETASSMVVRADTVVDTNAPHVTGLSEDALESVNRSRLTDTYRGPRRKFVRLAAVAAFSVAAALNAAPTIAADQVPSVPTAKISHGEPSQATDMALSGRVDTPLLRLTRQNAVTSEASQVISQPQGRLGWWMGTYTKLAVTAVNKDDLNNVVTKWYKSSKCFYALSPSEIDNFIMQPFLINDPKSDNRKYSIIRRVENKYLLEQLFRKFEYKFNFTVPFCEVPYYEATVDLPVNVEAEPTRQFRDMLIDDKLTGCMGMDLKWFEQRGVENSPGTFKRISKWSTGDSLKIGSLRILPGRNLLPEIYNVNDIVTVPYCLPTKLNNPREGVTIRALTKDHPVPQSVTSAPNRSQSPNPDVHNTDRVLWKTVIRGTGSERRPIQFYMEKKYIPKTASEARRVNKFMREMVAVCWRNAIDYDATKVDIGFNNCSLADKGAYVG